MCKEQEQVIGDLESSCKNKEKDKDQMLIENKSLQKRLETERQRAEVLQSHLNTKELELTKSKEILNVANKNLKQKDAEN